MGRALPIALSAFCVAASLSLCGIARGGDSPNEPRSMRPASAPADDHLIQAAKSLELHVRPLLPKGWSVSRLGNRVVIEREAIVEVFNAIQLPHSKSEAARREYVRASLRRVKFMLSLRVDNWIPQEAYDRQSRKNYYAVERARRDEKDPMLLPDDDYWRKHPKYGYKELPWLDDGSHSIYAECSVFWLEEFWDADVWVECDRVLKAVAAPFRAYRNDFQFFQRPSPK